MSQRDQLERIQQLPPAMRARLLDQLRSEAASQARAEAIGRRPQGAAIELSAAQRQLWFLDRLAPGSTAYNMPMAVEARGELEIRALARAIRRVVERHQVLRTVFPDERHSDEPVALLLAAEEGFPRLVLVDLQGLTPERSRQVERRLIDGEGSRPFDLRRGPLLRSLALRRGSEEHVLLFTLHHIAGDGWSSGLLIDEVARGYAGEIGGGAAALPALPIQYADYAAWQNAQLSTEKIAPSLAFWRHHLDGAARRIDLPFDHPARQGDSVDGAQLPIALPQPLCERLERMAQEHDATLFMVTLATFLLLLERYTAQRDLVVGTPLAGRERPELEALIGFFVNTLPLRFEIPAAGIPFDRFLEAVKESSLACFSHQKVPLERLVTELAPQRTASKRHSAPSPLFNVLFAMQNATRRKLELAGLSLTTVRAGAGTSKFDLTLSLDEEEAGLSGFWEYRPSLFEAATIDRLAGHYRSLLEAVAAAPGGRIDRLPMLSPAEIRQLTGEWNDASGGAEAAPQPMGGELRPQRSVATTVLIRARQIPGAIAVKEGDRRLSYGELDRRSAQLATRLERLRIRAEEPVALVMERSADLPVALLAVLRAGGAYLMIDPAASEEQIARLLSVAGVRVVIADRGQLERLRGLAAPSPAVVDGGPPVAGSTTARSPRISEKVHPDRLAAILYTATASDRPRGIGLTHDGLNRWVAGSGGGSVQIEADRIALFSATDHEEALLAAWPALAAGTCLDLDAVQPLSGSLVAGSRAYVVHRGHSGLLAPVGVVGELWIGGADLARGYLGQPALTAARFLPDGWSGVAGSRLYRTEDLARRHSDGTLQLLGSAADLDRAGCSELAAADTEAQQRFIAPRTPLESRIAELWRELLGVERVSVRDNFFTLGGHSLMATRLIARLRRVLGHEVALEELFAAPTIEALAQSITRRIEQGESPAAEAAQSGLKRLDRKAGEAQPLSFAQARMWLLDRLSAQPAAYHIAAAVELRGRLDTALLARALASVEERHEPLRARFLEVAGEPRQRFLTPRDLREILPVVELAALPARWREPTRQRLSRAAARHPFDLAADAPWRCCLLRSAAGEHSLVLTMHHIASDGWSAGVMVEEVTDFYAAAARSGPLRPAEEPEIRYGDFAAWQRRRFAAGALQSELAWWRDQLAGAPSSLELPADRPRPAVRRHVGAQADTRLDAALTGRLNQLANDRGLTLFTLLLAGLQALLMRYSGQQDVVVGSPVAGRTQPELEPLIGMFVNTLALRADFSARPGFLALLDQVQATTLGAFAHQELPFERLVEELTPERDQGRTPLFQVMLAWQNTPRAELELPGLSLRSSPVDTGTAKFDLVLNLAERGEGIAGSWEFDRDLFDSTTVARMDRHYRALLSEALERPRLPVEELPLLSPAERQQLAGEWSVSAQSLSVAGEAAGAIEEPVHHRFARLARRHPRRLAVVAGGQRLSYGALRSSALRLAVDLRRRGVGREVPVAVLLDRSPHYLVAVLAILEVGAAYLPIDPAYPDERIAFMLRDSGAPVLLTGAAGAERWARCEQSKSTAATVVAVELSSVRQGDDEGELPAVDPRQIAYVIYTSGSTGRPKGVQIAHRGLSELVAWYRSTYGYQAQERVSWSASPAFDATVLEIWPTLTSGGTLCVPPDELRGSVESLGRWLLGERIALAFLSTALSEGLLAQPWPAATPLRALMTGGDRLARRPPAGLPFTLYNHYGPTEVTVVSSATPVESRGSGSPAIGRAIAGIKLWVVRYPRRPVPVPLGVAGELWIGGHHLARGYLGQPALTAEKFLPDSLSGASGGRVYRSGDLVRQRQDGQLEFLGRIDHQVKIRGFRIELGEIEAVLLAHPRIEAAVVDVRTSAAGDLRLAAWVVAADGEPGGAAPAEPLTVTAIAEWLRRELPDYMVPSAIVPVDELSLTAHGKLDRSALPAPRWGLLAGDRRWVAPRPGIEATLAGQWRDLLAVERVGALDSFFDLGGHSLLATRVISRVRELFDVELSLRDFFATPTLRHQADRIAAARLAGESGSEAAATLAPPLVARGPGDEPLLSFAQERLWFLDQLDPGGSAYNLPIAVDLRGQLDAAALAASLAAVVQRHESLRTTIQDDDGVPRPRIASPPAVRLPAVDLSALSEAEGDRLLCALTALEAERPFDLTTGPLWRPLLLRLTALHHRLVLSMHHIVSDGWSMGVLVEEVTRGYSARLGRGDRELPALPIQYSDYAAWQHSPAVERQLAVQLDYWRQRLEGVPQLELVTDRPRRALARQRGAGVAHRLGPELTAAVDRLAGASGSTPFIVVLAALAAVLVRRATGEGQVLIGTPVANRERCEIEPLIGLFVNTLVFHLDLSGRPTIEELIVQARETSLDGYAHQALPFERLVDALGIERTTDRSPLFQVMLAFQNAPRRELALPGLSAEVVEIDTATSKFDLSLFALHESEGDERRLRLGGQYNTDLFDRTTISRLLSQVESFLAQAVAQPGRSLRVLSLLSPG